MKVAVLWRQLTKPGSVQVCTSPTTLKFPHLGRFLSVFLVKKNLKDIHFIKRKSNELPSLNNSDPNSR